jgi:hypothetical protein
MLATIIEGAAAAVVVLSTLCAAQSEAVPDFTLFEPDSLQMRGIRDRICSAGRVEVLRVGEWLAIDAERPLLGGHRILAQGHDLDPASVIRICDAFDDAILPDSMAPDSIFLPVYGLRFSGSKGSIEALVDRDSRYWSFYVGDSIVSLPSARRIGESLRGLLYAALQEKDRPPPVAGPSDGKRREDGAQFDEPVAPWVRRFPARYDEVYFACLAFVAHSGGFRTGVLSVRLCPATYRSHPRIPRFALDRCAMYSLQLRAIAEDTTEVGLVIRESNPGVGMDSPPGEVGPTLTTPGLYAEAFARIAVEIDRKVPVPESLRRNK